MKEIFKTGFKISGKFIVAIIMCVFIIISLSMVVTVLGTENVGYIAYGTSSGSTEKEQLYEHYYENGEDELYDSYVEEGYTVTKTFLRSNLDPSAEMVYLVLTQVFSTLILLTFVYPPFWEYGSKHRQAEKSGRGKASYIFPVASGLVAIAPYVILTLVFYFAVPDFPLAIFKFLFSFNYSFNSWIFGSAVTFAELNILQLLLSFAPFLIVPVVALISYILGNKNILIFENLVYKKKK